MYVWRSGIVLSVGGGRRRKNIYVLDRPSQIQELQHQPSGKLVKGLFSSSLFKACHHPLQGLVRIQLSASLMILLYSQWLTALYLDTKNIELWCGVAVNNCQREEGAEFFSPGCQERKIHYFQLIRERRGTFVCGCLGPEGGLCL